MTPQKAVFHAPGLFSAVSLWRSERGGRSAARSALDAWMGELEADGRVLAVVGVRSDWWIGVAQEVLPREAHGQRIPSTQTDVLLQLSCEDREGLLWAMHRARALFAGALVEVEELLGGRIGEGREPFGYLDAVDPPSQDQIRSVALVETPPLEGGTWLLFLRFQQDLQRFWALKESQQRRVIGRGRDGQEVPDAPGDAHVRRMREAGYGGNRGLIRRGFPFRQSREEGLAFVALAREQAALARALDAMLGVHHHAPESLFRYAQPVSGGVYAVPPREWFGAL